MHTVFTHRNSIKMQILLTMTQKLNTIAIKISTSFFVDTKIILKYRKIKEID